MKIYVEIKNVYGNDLIYPYCEKAKLFTGITNSKTLNKLQINVIKELGYEIICKTPTI
tara:strand:+ start:124 stop:297 length:174 start_codon:yes stop_codon:yes gene_type:complete